MENNNIYYGLEITWRMINKTINRPNKAVPHWIFIKGYDVASDKAYAEMNGYKWKKTQDRCIFSKRGQTTNNVHDKFCPHCHVEMIGKPEVMSETIARFKKEVLEEMEANDERE